MQKEDNQEKKELPAGFDFETYRQQVIDGLMKGQPLTGESGLLKPLIANFVQGALDAELSDHLSEERKEGRKECPTAGTENKVNVFEQNQAIFQ